MILQQRRRDVNRRTRPDRGYRSLTEAGGEGAKSKKKIYKLNINFLTNLTNLTKLNNYLKLKNECGTLLAEGVIHISKISEVRYIYYTSLLFVM